MQKVIKKIIKEAKWIIADDSWLEKKVLHKTIILPKNETIV